MRGLSLVQAEYLVKDRLSWMRFCGRGPGDTVPDANTLWDFREAMIAAAHWRRCSHGSSAPLPRLATCRCPADRGRDACGSVPSAADGRGEGDDQGRPPGVRDLAREEGQGAPEGHRCGLDDVVFQGQARRRRCAAGRHRGSDVRRQEPNLGRSAARDHSPANGDTCRGPRGAQLREGLIDPNNTASDVWADTAYHSESNERYLAMPAT